MAFDSSGVLVWVGDEKVLLLIPCVVLDLYGLNKYPGYSKTNKRTNKEVPLLTYFTKQEQQQDVDTNEGKQGWRSGESTRLPPMWPGFKILIHFLSPKVLKTIS